ncbi:MAG TPA: hypothetical protein VFN21_10670, partial [Acidimicrobiales bacterium]|nr:hypothetical protein [Acidimicrobiales bacterium]
PLLTGAAAATVKTLLQSGVHGTLEARVADANPMRQLCAFLATPAIDDWEGLARAQVAGLAHAADGPGRHDRDDAAALVNAAVAGNPLASPIPTGTASDELLAWSWTTPNGLALTALLDTRASIGGPDAERWCVIGSIDDRHPAIDQPMHTQRWRDWLQWTNLLQFLRTDREAVIATVSMADHLDPADLTIVGAATGAKTDPNVPAEAANAGSPAGLSAEAHQALDDLVDDQVCTLVQAVLVAGAPVPEVGYELDGMPVEAAWPDERVAVLTGSEPDELRAALDAAGWTFHAVDDWDTNALATALGIGD